jgi:isocitrate dehydrogenase
MLRITVAKGDGIGPSIMDATLQILKEAHVPLEFDFIEIGEKAYLSGHQSGLAPESWDILLKNKVFLKAPITTPQGGGYKSLNVSVRKRLGLYANIRPCRSYPFLATLHPNMDLVVVRENEEDLYAGVEYQLSSQMYEARKWISQSGCEKIVRYAFEYAKTNGRKHVTCMTKDNIMKITDGLFHKTFERMAKEYPEIQSDHYIVDIGAARLAHQPQLFDVVVTLNLYGDILSDITALGMGSVGLGASSNLGDNYAMFEAVHGSAPNMNPQEANPSGLLLSSVEMLHYLNLHEDADRIFQAWFQTMKEGVHTKDLYKEGQSQKKVGTLEFARAVCDRLKPREKHETPSLPSLAGNFCETDFPPLPKVVGFDIILAKSERLDQVVEAMKAFEPMFRLSDVSQIGSKVWPHASRTDVEFDGLRIRLLSTETLSWKDLFSKLQSFPYEFSQVIALYEKNFSQTQGL